MSAWPNIKIGSGTKVHQATWWNGDMAMTLCGMTADRYRTTSDAVNCKRCSHKHLWRADDERILAAAGPGGET